jgi:hypothetical protein
MQRLVPLLVVILLFLSGVSADPGPPQKTPTLVEVRGLPHCAGLDCPPWPTPISVDVCLRVDDAYYTGMYRPWGAPWAASGKKLLVLKGQSVEVVVTDADIRVIAPRMRLQRMHNYRVFTSSSCNNA